VAARLNPDGLALAGSETSTLLVGRFSWEEGYADGLRRCVVNRSYDVLRRRRLEQRFRLLHRDDRTTELEADELGDALASLAPKRRAAVVLRYYAGLPEREIAEVLRVRPRTVKSMLHRALAQLREVIDR
jgi:RNA polymerase sigma factor (sigma-70 family)